MLWPCHGGASHELNSFFKNANAPPYSGVLLYIRRGRVSFGFLARRRVFDRSYLLPEMRDEFGSGGTRPSSSRALCASSAEGS
jgi:hypothetical protein